MFSTSSKNKSYQYFWNPHKKKKKIQENHLAYLNSSDIITTVTSTLIMTILPDNHLRWFRIRRIIQLRRLLHRRWCGKGEWGLLRWEQRQMLLMPFGTEELEETRCYCTWWHLPPSRSTGDLVEIATIERYRNHCIRLSTSFRISPLSYETMEFGSIYHYIYSDIRVSWKTRLWQIF